MRRIVAVLLAMVLLGSSMDMSKVAVQAAESAPAKIGETTYSSIEAAMAAAESGQAVVALADYTADFSIREGVIFDGGNFLFNGDIENQGTISGGTYNGAIENDGTINGGIYNGFINNQGTINKATFNGLVGNNGTINNLNAGDILLGSSFSFMDKVGNVLCTAHIYATDCEEICRLCRQLNVSAALHTIGADNKCTKCLNPAIARIDDRYFVSWRCMEVAGNNATADNPVTVTALASDNGHFEIPQYVIFDGGSFTFSYVDNGGVIEGGVFSGRVVNKSNGTINGGVFNGGIFNGGVINNLNTGDVILKDAEKYQDGGGIIICQAHYSDANCGETANCKLCNASFTQNHIWNYVASGSDISRICQRTCQVSQSLTLMAPDSNSLIYDGTEKEATITGIFVSEVNSSITYNTTGGSAPIYPGNYTASIRLGDATATVSYEIGKATLTVTGATAVGREYDGMNRVEIDDITLNGLVSPDVVTVDLTNLWGTIGSTNVGTYREVTLPALTLTGTHKDYYVLKQPTEAVPATVTISKASVTPGMPDAAMGVANRYTKVGDIPLAANWQWQDADKETALEVETPVSATAEYVAADKDNYENISVTVTITRAACDHVAGNVLYTGTGEKAPTCTESGLGHKECTKCGTVMESGIVVGVTEHSGELRHYEEPTCATEGYSGDTYCSGCGIWLSGGVTLSVTGHNYVGVVTRKATTDREGIRTYTCSKCGGSYTESIAKLIADTTAETPADKNDEKWEIIREELGDTNEGATVTVDMADTTVVPGTVFDDIKGKDITTIFVLENGITWSVNGKDITSEKVNDIDFGVKVGADANHTIPVEVINNVSGERSYTNISLAYEGEFGFKAVMALNMDAKNAGLFANLFYFNEQTNALEFICADEIAEDGTAELTFTHASEYTVVIDTEEMSGALDSSDASDTTEPDTEVNVEPEAEAEPANGESALWIILLAVLAAVIGAVVAWKRRKN